MKKNRLVALISLLLCAALLLSGCSLFGVDIDIPNPFDSSGADAAPPAHAWERRTIPYAEMTYTRPDVEAIKVRTVAATEELKAAADFDAVMALDEELGELYEAFNTMESLAFLRSFQDVNDAYFDEEYRYCNDAGVELSVLLNDYSSELVYGPFANDYREWVGDYAFEQLQTSLLMINEGVQPYKTRRNTLETDYQNDMTTLTVTFEGVPYTLDEIYEQESSTLVSQLLTLYYEEYLDYYAGMLAELVSLDKQTAFELGFNSAAEMTYLQYGRDYTPSDAQEIFSAVKALFVPMMYDVWGTPTGEESLEMQPVFDAMPAALEKVDPSLRESFEKMLEYGLYDCEARAGKKVGREFTATLSAYDTAFILTYWKDDLRSASTLVHEFGHFYDEWIHYDAYSQSLDANEVSSQALELILTPLYEEITPYAEDIELHLLKDILVNTLIYQSCLEDFLLQLYQLDSFDADIISALYGQVLQQYGFGNGQPAHDWIEVGHLFYAPFYTVSYVTSALVALQIWSLANQNWDEGAAAYMAFLTADPMQPFSTLVQAAGLNPVHERGTLTAIARQYKKTFGL